VYKAVILVGAWSKEYINGESRLCSGVSKGGSVGSMEPPF